MLASIRKRRISELSTVEIVTMLKISGELLKLKALVNDYHKHTAHNKCAQDRDGAREKSL